MVNADSELGRERARRLERSTVFWIFAFSAVFGSVSLIYPYGRDQGSYGYAAWVLLDGGMPYLDVYAYKPPMNVLLHALAMAAFGVNTWAIRAMDILWTAATGWVVASIALELWRRRDSALLAGVAVPFFYYQIDYWTTAQTDGWMTLPSALAVYAALRGGRALASAPQRAVMWWVGSGASAGVAVLFKYTAGLIALPMLLGLAWCRATYDRRVWFGAPAMALGGVLALVLCWAWLSLGGAWDAFLEIQFGLASYIDYRADVTDVRQTLTWLLSLERTKTDLVPLVLSPFMALAPALVSGWPRSRADGIGWALVVCWWLCAFGNVLVQGKFYDYHYLPLLAPSALVTGLGLGAVLRPLFSRSPSGPFRAAGMAALLVVAVVVTPIGGRAVELVRVVSGTQTMQEYIASRSEYALSLYDVGDIRGVATLIDEMTGPEERVFVWGYAPTILVRARRHTVSRFLYNFPLRTDWEDPKLKDELIRALRGRPPEVFVVASQDPYSGFTGDKKDSATLLREFDALRGFLEAHYTPHVRVGRYMVYRLEARPKTSERQ